MTRRPLMWRMFPALAAVAVAVTALSLAFTARRLRAGYVEQAKQELHARAAAVVERVGPAMSEGDRGRVWALGDVLGAAATDRLTIIDPDGSVWFDSGKDVRVMENHANRPEVAEALRGRESVSLRWSDSRQVETLYAAIPVLREGRVVGVVRAARMMSEFDAVLAEAMLEAAAGVLVVAVLGAAGGIVVFHHFAGRKLDSIRVSARRFADGDLTHHVEVDSSRELGGLAESLNTMAAQLDEKIRMITRQSREQQAVLASMIEGVLAIDAQSHILSFNAASARLLGIDPAKAQGRKIQEVVRNTALHRFVDASLTSAEPVEADIVLSVADRFGGAAAPGESERHIHVSGTVLRDAAGKGIGALVVFNDVTRLRKLENVRQDFVANVSHELKTPVAAIKGSIETLLDPHADPGDAPRFLEIIARQADRLNAIIEDLLRLSRLEQDGERGQVETTTQKLADVLRSAINDVAASAAEKNIAVQLDCPADLAARINAPLIEQAVVNLLDNAVKYSGSGTTVSVAARASDAQLRIEVRDNGPGIAAEHLPRIFERFYRVDKARSRKAGGTGLGLAIVKHIAQAHRGSVGVQSTPGKGSVFVISLPAGEG